MNSARLTATDGGNAGFTRSRRDLVGAGSVTSHVLDDTGLLAGEFADMKLVSAGTGIQLCGLINRCLQICLGSLLGQIRTRDVDLKGGLVRVNGDDIEIFEIH